MNNSDGFSSYSEKFSNVGSVDQIVHKLNERYTEQASELEALRVRGDQLMARLSEQKQQLEFEAQKREELHQKIVKITDENWAKDLDIAHLRELDVQNQADLKRTKAELSALNSKLVAGSRTIEILNHSISNKDNDIARIKHESEQALAGLRVRHDGEIQQLVAKEAKQTQLIETLQTNIAHLKMQLSEIKESSSHEISKAFAEFELFKKHVSEQAARDQIEHTEQIEQASQLISAFEQEREERLTAAQRDAEVIERLSLRDGQMEAEIHALKSQVDALMTRAENESRNMQNWQAQLSQREQQLAKTSDSVHFEKTTLIRLAMKLAAELNMARTTHPLKDYVGVIESEIASLQIKLKQVPSQSLDRVKIVDGFKLVTKKRDFLNSILAESQKQLEERANGIMAALMEPRATQDADGSAN